MPVEAVEGAGPAAAMPVALLDRLERNLAEGHAGLARLLGEGHRHQGLQAALALLLPREGEDEALGRSHLAEDTAMPELLAGLGRREAVAPATAGSNVHF